MGPGRPDAHRPEQNASARDVLEQEFGEDERLAAVSGPRCAPNAHDISRSERQPKQIRCRRRIEDAAVGDCYSV
jgi:hypothetical protein